MRRLLRVAKTVPCTTAEGPHARLALWVAGCSLHCPGCCNPDLFDRDGGDLWHRDDLERALASARLDPAVEGITVLGGEPLEQPQGLTALLRAATTRGLGVVLFTGFTLAEARERPGFEAIWPHVDTLVDGRFDPTQPERIRRYVGSRNQTLVHRTSRYADPRLWTGPTRIEVRIDARGRVEAHGLPRPVARLRRVLRQP